MAAQSSSDPHQTPISALGIEDGATVAVLNLDVEDIRDLPVDSQPSSTALSGEAADEPNTVCDLL